MILDQINSYKSITDVEDSNVNLSTVNERLHSTKDVLKYQLHEEITNRKLAEQKSDSLHTQLNELKYAKVTVKFLYPNHNNTALLYYFAEYDIKKILTRRGRPKTMSCCHLKKNN